MESTAELSESLVSRARRWSRWRLGSGLSKLGERLGLNWLVYNPLHFHSFHDHAVRNAPGVISALTGRFPAARSFIDIGAGSGAFAAELVRRGFEVVALEHSATGRRLGRSQGVDMRAFDLTGDLEPVEKRDVAYCFEVAEHLPPALGDRLVGFIAEAADVVVFTAAHPGQRGTGHINEQPKDYWVERFARCGLVLNGSLSTQLSEDFRRERVADWFSENVVVFERPKGVSRPRG